MAKLFLLLALLTLFINATLQASLLDNMSGKLYVGYHESWSDPLVTAGANTRLAKYPAYINVVVLSFVKPDCSYTAGSYNIGSTGFQFAYSGGILKDAIASLKATNPQTKVLLGVGGATYTNWGSLSEATIANIVSDFGLDGVDVDYEPSSYTCSYSGGSGSCTSDSQFISIINRVRAVISRPKIVSIAAVNVGAYGVGNFQNDKPVGSTSGMTVALLKSSAASGIDLINIMGYDAGISFDPTRALLAFQSLFSGKITVGVEVPAEAWGGHVYTIPKITSIAKFVNKHNGSGVMLWSLNKQITGAAGKYNPTVQMFHDTFCSILALPTCTPIA